MFDNSDKIVEAKRFSNAKKLLNETLKRNTTSKHTSDVLEKIETNGANLGLEQFWKRKNEFDFSHMTWGEAKKLLNIGIAQTPFNLNAWKNEIDVLIDRVSFVSWLKLKASWICAVAVVIFLLSFTVLKFSKQEYILDDVHFANDVAKKILAFEGSSKNETTTYTKKEVKTKVESTGSASGLNDVASTLEELLNGTFIKLIAGVMVLGGLIAGAARQSLMAFAVGIGGAIGLVNMGTILRMETGDVGANEATYKMETIQTSHVQKMYTIKELISKNNNEKNLDEIKNRQEIVDELTKVDLDKSIISYTVAQLVLIREQNLSKATKFASFSDRSKEALKSAMETVSSTMNSHKSDWNSEVILDLELATYDVPISEVAKLEKSKNDARYKKIVNFVTFFEIIACACIGLVMLLIMAEQLFHRRVNMIQNHLSILNQKN